jgi:excisionase family DNA binding protein
MRSGVVTRPVEEEPAPVQDLQRSHSRDRSTTPSNAVPGDHAHRPAIQRLAYSIEEAAEAIGVSGDFFREHVAPDLRIVRVGRRRLVPVRELERWLDDTAARALS